MPLTPLENAVLQWIADHTSDDALRHQCRHATVTARPFTGVGCFTTLHVPPDSPKTTQRVYSEIAPGIDSPDLHLGAGTLLFCENGLLHTLEFFTYGDPFPQDLQHWRLIPGPKSLAAPPPPKSAPRRTGDVPQPIARTPQ